MKLDPKNTITVGELKMLLELHDPNSLIYVHDEYAPTRRPWNTVIIYTDDNPLLQIEYIKGDIVSVRPKI